MAMYAPENPTLHDLESRYPLTDDTKAQIQIARANVGAALADGFVLIEGPCAMTLDRGIINDEGDALAAAQRSVDGLVTLHRMPTWKPRTNPADWHGLESEPATTEAAYRTVAQRAAATANVALEIGHEPHLERYGPRISMGWIGSRNVGQLALVRAIAGYDPTLPVAVKNGMDGTIDGALRHVRNISLLRKNQGVEPVLMYRGGTNAKNPKSWEYNYRLALEQTGGRTIVDTAHGGEMAFSENYQKSRIGQICCLEAVLRIAEDHGEVPAGIIMEASSAKSPTDPVAPFRVMLHAAKRLAELRN